MADNVLSQNEVDALLEAVSVGDVAIKKTRKTNKKKCSSYNFRNPISISREKLRVVRAIHDNFARHCSVLLAGFLRTEVHIEVVSVDRLTYQEFMLSLPECTCLNIVQMEPLKGNMILEINVDILLLFIERMLGGEGKAVMQARSLTELESTMATRIIEKILKEYKAAWNHIVDFKPKIGVVSADPRFTKVCRDEDTVLLICFEVKVGDGTGIINICFPMQMFETLIPKLTVEKAKDNIKRKGKAGQTDMQKALLKLNMPVRLVLDEIPLKVNEITNINEGDIIKLNVSKSPEIKVMMEKNYLFSGKAGVRDNKQVVQIRKKLF